VISVVSIFRDSTGYIDRYIDQVGALEDVLGEPVRLVLAEGDSADDTFDKLEMCTRAGDELFKIDHGGPRYGSVEKVERWRQISYVCNALMGHLRPDGPVIYVESDLMWVPRTMVTLLEDLEDVPAVAPLSLRGDVFYDTWGHRGIDGVRFRKREPYHADLIHLAPLVEIGSAGSCVAMRPDVAKLARWGDDDAMVGLGRSIRERFTLWLDKRVKVHHP